MNYSTFVRRPFTVSAVEITEDNIAEIANHIGKLMINGEGDTFISLDRRVIPNVGKAYIGWFLTLMSGNYRCYAPRVFHEQFQDWEPIVTFEFPEEELETEVEHPNFAPDVSNVFDIQSGEAVPEDLLSTTNPPHTHGFDCT